MAAMHSTEHSVHGQRWLRPLLALLLALPFASSAAGPQTARADGMSIAGLPAGGQPAGQPRAAETSAGALVPVPASPDIALGPLFEAVQEARLFPDQKTFVDAVPRQPPAELVALWQAQRTEPGFSLAAFVEQHFQLPATVAVAAPAAAQRAAAQPVAAAHLRGHIDALWPQLTREAAPVSVLDSLLPLPGAYVVPGGRFREVYYWDSYFTMLGLASSGRWDLVRSMVDNFAWQLDQYGHVPNGNRSYYLSRSQPPFFSHMVELLATHEGKGTLARYLPQLRREHDYWMAGSARLKAGESRDTVVRMPDGALLNRYWDAADTPRPESWWEDRQSAAALPPARHAQLYRDLRAAAASGWDFSSRWMDDPHALSSIRTTDIVPVDLNSLLLHLEQTLAKASAETGDTAARTHFDALAAQRTAAINRWLWDVRNNWYGDHDLKHGRQRGMLTAAAAFPLQVGAATQGRAVRVANALERNLLRPGGLATTTVDSGQQWDAGNGWAPLQWMAVSGLQRYGQDALARRIALRFLDNVQAVYQREHKLVEKYAVDGGGGGGGEYPLQDGFGWSNGVTLDLMERYCTQPAGCSDVQDLPAGGR